MKRSIVIVGASEHNLKNLALELPRDKLIVITGLSGSGKSSLAFDTIYAEGQRRYAESLSAYARQYLEQLHKPDVERIDGLSPTLAIEQRQAVSSPRSIVATITELYDYFRLLYARAGRVHCYECGRPVSRQSPEEITESVLALPEKTRVMVLAPLAQGTARNPVDLIEIAKSEGFVRYRIDGTIYDADALPELANEVEHEVHVVVDRLVIKRDIRSRLHMSLETALKVGQGIVIIAAEENGAWRDTRYSELYSCPDCNVRIEELSPRNFSFNSPYGACPECSGLGVRLELDLELLVPDPRKSLREGAFEVLLNPRIGAGRRYHRQLLRFAKKHDIDTRLPFEKLPEDVKELLLYGPPEAKPRRGRRRRFEGVITNLQRRFRETENEALKEQLMSYMSELPCHACKGARLRPEVRAVTFMNKPIYELLQLSISQAAEFFAREPDEQTSALIAQPILKQIRSRLAFLNHVGLSYIGLDRLSRTLSGGEWQRIRLATQVGAGLAGVCYVLDEPTIGLHQRDNARLIETLKHLRDLGNTVIVVEHDEQTIRSADHLVDLGPGPGVQGGEVVAQGTLDDIMAAPRSVTGQYLRGRRKIPVRKVRRPLNTKRSIRIHGARENNLKSITVEFPLGGIVCVTGVSGSGKSTLVNQTLVPALRRVLHGAEERPGRHDKIEGVECVDKVIGIDQSPIGRTPRSNAATYTGLYTHIREIFAQLRESRVRGYSPGRFSFNVKGGRCEACQGQGLKKIEMHFLPDIYVTCEICQGRRYNRETLDVRFKGYNIADVLDMSVDQAAELFKNFPAPARILGTLQEVGLGYLTLGQSSTTLSGGEAQRVKLAAELARLSTGNTLYVLDEPTTGLHFEDIRKLLAVLNRLADRGNTLIVIEHNLDVIKCADWIIDLGPEGGDAGGQVVASGPPEAIATTPGSYTGMFLKRCLGI